MSITTLSANLTHTLHLHRCYSCRRYYASECDENTGCGICARQTVSEKRLEIKHLNRTISALRGALTKARNGATT